MITADIKRGIISKDDINPSFALKFDIFKILEHRGVINFLCNTNIDDEIKEFHKLYDVCCEDLPEHTPSDPNTEKIFQ